MDLFFIVLRKKFYIRWSVGRSPRVHEVNPGRDPSMKFRLSRNSTKFDVVARFCEMISTMKSVLSSEI